MSKVTTSPFSSRRSTYAGGGDEGEHEELRREGSIVSIQSRHLSVSTKVSEILPQQSYIVGRCIIRVALSLYMLSFIHVHVNASLVPSPHVSPSEKQSSEQVEFLGPVP